MDNIDKVLEDILRRLYLSDTRLYYVGEVFRCNKVMSAYEILVPDYYPIYVKVYIDKDSEGYVTLGNLTLPGKDENVLVGKCVESIIDKILNCDAEFSVSNISSILPNLLK